MRTLLTVWSLVLWWLVAAVAIECHYSFTAAMDLRPGMVLLAALVATAAMLLAIHWKEKP